MPIAHLVRTGARAKLREERLPRGDVSGPTFWPSCFPGFSQNLYEMLKKSAQA